MSFISAGFLTGVLGAGGGGVGGGGAGFGAGRGVITGAEGLGGKGFGAAGFAGGNILLRTAGELDGADAGLFRSDNATGKSSSKLPSELKTLVHCPQRTLPPAFFNCSAEILK